MKGHLSFQKRRYVARSHENFYIAKIKAAKTAVIQLVRLCSHVLFTQQLWTGVTYNIWGLRLSFCLGAKAGPGYCSARGQLGRPKTFAINNLLNKCSVLCRIKCQSKCSPGMSKPRSELKEGNIVLPGK